MSGAANPSGPAMLNSSILSTLDYYTGSDYWTEYGDPRLRNVTFLVSFRPALMILLAWSVFVKWIGPEYMRNREAMSLRRTLLIYNIFMTSMNGVFFLNMLIHSRHYIGYMLDVTFPISFDSTSEFDTYVIRVNYYYLLSKYVDLFDTVFFVLRKKQDHITFLHFYHHLSVPLLGWIFMRQNAICNALMLMGALNSLVHTLMYGYYALAALGLRPWWKRFVTQLQIVQFGILGIYGLYFMTFQKGYHLLNIVNFLFHDCLYLTLFIRFYVKTYDRKAKLGKSN